MNKNAYDKIMAGLDDAIAHASGGLSCGVAHVRQIKVSPKPVKVPLDADIISSLRSSGEDWLMRLNGFLHAVIERGQL